MFGVLRKSNERWAIVAGMRVRILGTPLRGVVAERLENICLVYRDDTTKPTQLLYHVKDLEIV